MHRRTFVKAAATTPFVGTAAASPTVEVRVYVTEAVWQGHGWQPAKNVVTYAREMLGWDGYAFDIDVNYYLIPLASDDLHDALYEWYNDSARVTCPWASAKDSMLLITDLADKNDAVWGYSSEPGGATHPNAVIGGAGHLAALDTHTDRGDWYDYDHRFMNAAVHEVLHTLGYRHEDGSITSNLANTELSISPLAHGQFDADLCVNDHPLDDPERWWAEHAVSACVRDTDPTVQ